MQKRLFESSQWILIAAIMAGISSSSCRDWTRADAFADGLRCGMSVADVRARARSFGASEFIADDRVPILYGTHVAANGSSRVYLGFTRSRLQWVRRGSQAGPWTGMRIGTKRDLCSGRELVSLVIHCSSGWERAEVIINGKPAGTLSSAPPLLLETDVPVGQVDVVIRAAQSTYQKRLLADSKGIVQIDVPRPVPPG
jgi:hypothetical protein